MAERTLQDLIDDGILKPAPTQQQTTDATPFSYGDGDTGDGYSADFGIFNKALIDSFMLPVDVATWPFRKAQDALFGLDTPSYSEQASDMFRSIGTDVAPVDAQPEGTAQNLLYGLGTGIGSVVPVAGLSATAAKYGGPLVSSVGQTIFEPFKQAPAAAAGVEALIGVGAGAGREVIAPKLVELGMSEEDAMLYSELLGGLGTAGVSAATTAGVSAGTRAISENVPQAQVITRALRAIFDPTSTAKLRAQETVRKAVGDPEEAAAAAVDDTLIGLSPAQRVGTDDMLSLEQAIRHDSADFDAAAVEREAQAIERARATIQAAGEGVSPEETRYFFEQLENEFHGQINLRLEAIKNRVDEAVLNAGPETGFDPAELSRMFRTELDSAYSAAKDKETALWDRVDQNAEVTLFSPAYETPLESAVNTIMGEVSTDTWRHLPAQLRKGGSLNEDSKNFLGDVNTIKELRGTQSDLSAVSGQTDTSDTTKRWNSMLQDAIMETMAEAPDVADAVDIARTYTRTLHDVFESGYVGTVLKSGKFGRDTVSPEQTLRRFLGTDEGAAVSNRELESVFSLTDEADPARAQELVQEYLRYSFVDRMQAPDGTLTPKSADRYVAQRSEFMKEYPELDQAFQDASSAVRQGAEAEKVVSADVAARADEPSTRFLTAQIDGEIDRAMRAQNPTYELSQLMAAAANDPSGQAELGLKTAVSDYLIKRMTDFPKGKPKTLTGEKGAYILDDEQTYDAFTEVFGADHMDKISQVVDELRTLSASRAQAGTKREILDTTTADWLVRKVAGVAGLFTTSNVRPSGPAALTVAGETRKMFDRVVESLRGVPAERLLKDALLDQTGEKLAALLVDSTSPMSARRRAANAFVLWAGEQSVSQSAQAEDPMQALEDALGVERETTGYTVPDQYNPLRIDIP